MHPLTCHAVECDLTSVLTCTSLNTQCRGRGRWGEKLRGALVVSVWDFIESNRCDLGSNPQHVQKKKMAQRATQLLASHVAPLTGDGLGIKRQVSKASPPAPAFRHRFPPPTSPRAAFWLLISVAASKARLERTR